MNKGKSLVGTKETLVDPKYKYSCSEKPSSLIHFTVRIPRPIYSEIKELSDSHGVSQAEIARRLIKKGRKEVLK